MLAELADRLIAGASPALSTAGMPGVGKTALAVALAHHQRLLKHFDGGVLWAGLGREPDVASIQASWATALGLDISDLVAPQQRQQVICNAIGQRRVLMVIDDAWTLEPAQQLRCSGQVVCLLTTRDDNIARKFAPDQNRHVPELEENPSVELLRSLAPEAYAADRDAIRQLAQVVGGLPLTLELLGGYLSESEHHRFPELMQQALTALADPQQRLDLSATRLGARADGKQTLQAVITLSLDHLAETRPAAVPTFYALGAFAPKPARFQRAAAEAVAECDTATLALLIARNLLEGEGDSLALHQTLADVAAQHCLDASRLAATARHRDHYLALVNEDRGDWQRIERLYPQILHAWQRQMVVEPDDEAVVSFTDALSDYQLNRGLWQDDLHWEEAALAFADKQKDDMERARFLNNIGLACSSLGEREKALGYYEQALPLRRQVGDRSGEAMTLNNIGVVYHSLGDMEKALGYFQRALVLSQSVGDVWGEIQRRWNIGDVYMDMGELDKAEAELMLAIEIAERVGHPDLASIRRWLTQVQAK